MTQSVYTTPLQTVMGRVVLGTEMPNDVAGLCDLIAGEALKSGAMDAVLKPLGDRIAAQRNPNLPGKESLAVREHLDALGEKIFQAGAMETPAASPEPVSPASSAGPKATQAGHAGTDPAHAPNHEFETGLMSPDALVRVARGVHKSYAKRSGLANDPQVYLSRSQLTKSAADIMNSVAKELPNGMPAPRIEVAKINSPSHYGHYNAKTHTIVVNENARITDPLGAKRAIPAFSGDAAGFKRLLGLIYHEARCRSCARPGDRRLGRHRPGGGGQPDRTERPIRRGEARP
jgi:hypothetical protein